MIDFTRRHFLFGVAATPLVVAAPKIYLMPKLNLPRMIELMRTSSTAPGLWVSQHQTGEIGFGDVNALAQAIDIRVNEDGTRSLMIAEDKAAKIIGMSSDGDMISVEIAPNTEPAGVTSRVEVVRGPFKLPA